MWWLVALLVQGLTALVLLLWDLVALLADLHVETGKKCGGSVGVVACGFVGAGLGCCGFVVVGLGRSAG